MGDSGPSLFCRTHGPARPIPQPREIALNETTTHLDTKRTPSPRTAPRDLDREIPGEDWSRIEGGASPFGSDIFQIANTREIAGDDLEQLRKRRQARNAMAVQALPSTRRGIPVTFDHRWSHILDPLVAFTRFR